MKKRSLKYRFVIYSPAHGNASFRFYRDMHYNTNGEWVPRVCVVIARGPEQEMRSYFEYHAMNKEMRSSVLNNFKKWCHLYVLNSMYFDPASDKVIEI